MNRYILSAGLRKRLERRGLAVLEARQVPPNDGGLSLGQIVCAARAAGGRGPVY